VIIRNYDKKNDIIGITFGRVEHSRELNNVNIVVDFDKEDNIIGIEIFYFLKTLKEDKKLMKELDKK